MDRDAKALADALAPDVVRVEGRITIRALRKLEGRGMLTVIVSEAQVLECYELPGFVGHSASVNIPAQGFGAVERFVFVCE